MALLRAPQEASKSAADAPGNPPLAYQAFLRAPIHLKKVRLSAAMQYHSCDFRVCATIVFLCATKQISSARASRVSRVLVLQQSTQKNTNLKSEKKNIFRCLRFDQCVAHCLRLLVLSVVSRYVLDI